MKIDKKEKTSQEKNELTDSVEEQITPSTEQVNVPAEVEEPIAKIEADLPSNVGLTDTLPEEVETTTEPVAETVEIDNLSEAKSILSDESPSEEKEIDIVADANAAPKATAPTIDEIKAAEIEKEQSPAEEVETHEEEQHLDYSGYTMKQLVQVVESLHQDTDFVQIGRILKEVKKAFDDHVLEDTKAALDKFIADGGEKDGFEYHPDELEQRFQQAYEKLRDRRNEFFNKLEVSKEQNLQMKLALLERLRLLVDSEETGSSLKSLKDIQTKWREIGPVPSVQVRSLWANYNALLDRFYDNRSIYYELKELDRKRNYELKLEMCERAENLSSGSDLGEMIRLLNDLHEEFKHIGPVPAESQDAIWERFKSASDKIYTRRKEHYDSLKEVMKANLIAKELLAEKLNALSGFESDRITEWNDKTKEIIQIQKDWEAIGSIPKEKAKRINKIFWSSFKTFFVKKSTFFKKIEEERKENLRLKQELLDKAEALKDSEDFRSASEELKKLQVRWKEIGPVPEKFRNEVFNKFKKACDHFFSRRRNKTESTEKEFGDNLKRKTDLCVQLEEMSKAGKTDLQLVNAIESEWSKIGFVPKENIKSIQKRYTDAIEKISGKADVSDTEKHKMRFNAQFGHGPGSEKIIQKQEGVLRRKISALESDVSIWKNNIDFFAASKNADKLKKEFMVKIDEANAELKSLKEQLKVISNI